MKRCLPQATIQVSNALRQRGGFVVCADPNIYAMVVVKHAFLHFALDSLKLVCILLLCTESDDLPHMYHG